MRAFSRRLTAYAAEENEPNRRQDLKMVGELIAHLEKLTL
jgi:hypothetical protein